jgi:hypothetical protein
MAPAIAADDLPRRLLAARPEWFGPLLDDPARVRLQILLTAPDGPGDGPLVTHAFRPDAEYVYPASTVKPLAAVAAMRTLRDLQDRLDSTEPDLGTPLTFHPAFPGAPLESHDPTNTPRGLITAGHDVRLACLVSDNPAHNRLYAIAGHRALHEIVWAAGLTSLRHHHRLADPRPPDEHRRTGRVDFLTRRGVVTIPARTSDLDLPPTAAPGLLIGERHVLGGRMVDGPMDFSRKNALSLTDLHRFILALHDPTHPAHAVDLGLHPDDAAFLRLAMTQWPRESASPRLDPAPYPDDFVKPLVPGVRRVWPAARTMNKLGQAYGFTLDTAVVTDPATGRWYALTASIYANASGTLGADTYDYATVARPFFERLGEVVTAWADATVRPAR